MTITERPRRAMDGTMKGMHTAKFLLGGLVLLAGGMPTWAEPARGHYEGDRHDSYAQQRDRAHDDHDRLRGQPWRPPAQSKKGPVSRLGTQHDESRGYDYHSRYDRHHRYDRDAGRAANAVRRDEHGRVLLSEPLDDHGYRVRVLTPDGYVRERYVDPRRDPRRRDPGRHRDH